MLRIRHYYYLITIIKIIQFLQILSMTLKNYPGVGIIIMEYSWLSKLSPLLEKLVYFDLLFFTIYLSKLIIINISEIQINNTY